METEWLARTRNMRISDTAIDSVAYLGIGDPSDEAAFDPRGTCFFVTIPDGAICLVTADHVAKGLGDGGFSVRLTRHDNGLGRCHLIEHAHWIRHPTEPEKVDLAVLEFRPPEWCEIGVVARRSFLSDFKLGTKSIGPGDLAYVVGLFEPMYGKRKNMPCVNTGHIAMIPKDELLPVENWNAEKPSDPKMIEVEGYLIQVQNVLPGISGAPVFVRRSIERRIDDPAIDKAGPIEMWNHGSLWLLGVWTDGWFNHIALRAPKGRRETIPAGMGAVVPARKLIEVLEQPTLIKGAPH